MDFINRAKNNVLKKVTSNNAQNEFLKKLEENSLSELIIDFNSITTFDAVNQQRNQYNYEMPSTSACKSSINFNEICSNSEGINFIAAEAPSEETVNDFYAMIFEKNVGKIIMLSECIESEEVKCFQYFPITGRKSLANFSIKMVDFNEIIFIHNKTEATIIQRSLQITNLISNVEKVIVHYQYINWPEHGIPSDTKALIFLYQIALSGASNQPILVHSSEGIGRTGVFIGGQFFYELFAKNQLESMKDGLIKLRKQRNGAIPRPIQYIFLHALLIDVLFVKDSKADKEKLLKLKEKYGEILMQISSPTTKPSLFKRMNSAPA